MRLNDAKTDISIEISTNLRSAQLDLAPFPTSYRADRCVELGAGSNRWMYCINGGIWVPGVCPRPGGCVQRYTNQLWLFPYCPNAINVAPLCMLCPV